MDLGLLLLRVVVGAVLAAHGAQKLFGLFGGFGIQGTGGWLESLGFRPGAAYARINGLTEFGGGLLLAVGLLTPFAAAAIIGVMITAIATVHWDKGFFNTAGGYEFNLTLIAASIALAMTGAGAYSLDYALDLGLSGIVWGLAALALGGLGAALTLSMRKPVPVAAPSPETTAVVDLTKEEELARADR
jgi:putative oxidoreductase